MTPLWKSWLIEKRGIPGDAPPGRRPKPSESTHLPSPHNRQGIGLDNMQSKEEVAAQARTAGQHIHIYGLGGEENPKEAILGDIRTRKAWKSWLKEKQAPEDLKEKPQPSNLPKQYKRENFPLGGPADQSHAEQSTTERERSFNDPLTPPLTSEGKKRGVYPRTRDWQYQYRLHDPRKRTRRGTTSEWAPYEKSFFTFMSKYSNFGEQQEEVDTAAKKRADSIAAKRERLRDQDIQDAYDADHYSHIESHWDDDRSGNSEETCSTCQDGPEEITDSYFDDMSDDDIESYEEKVKKSFFELMKEDVVPGHYKDPEDIKFAKRKKKKPTQSYHRFEDGKIVESSYKSFFEFMKSGGKFRLDLDLTKKPQKLGAPETTPKPETAPTPETEAPEAPVVKSLWKSWLKEKQAINTKQAREKLPRKEYCPTCGQVDPVASGQQKEEGQSHGEQSTAARGGSTDDIRETKDRRDPMYPWEETSPKISGWKTGRTGRGGNQEALYQDLGDPRDYSKEYYPGQMSDSDDKGINVHMDKLRHYDREGFNKRQRDDKGAMKKSFFEFMSKDSKCERCGKKYDKHTSHGIEGECTDCFLDEKNPKGLDLRQEIAEAEEARKQGKGYGVNE